MRVAEGACAGLSGRWRGGRATLRPGEIRFQKFVPPGIRLRVPFADDVVVLTDGIGLGRRRPSLRESWSVSAACEVLFITTATAQVEWAVLPAQVEWALAMVRAPLSPGPCDGGR